MNPQTSARIASYLDLEVEDDLSASLSSDEDKEEELQHSIISIEVDHYSYNENEQFMIVRTIEEMHDNKEKFNVIQTLRIYQDKYNS